MLLYMQKLDQDEQQDDAAHHDTAAELGEAGDVEPWFAACRLIGARQGIDALGV